VGPSRCRSAGGATTGATFACSTLTALDARRRRRFRVPPRAALPAGSDSPCQVP
jgi:hypothetical protein